MMRHKFELRKPVTPYVCSTPLDFNEERQFLSDEVFPKIRDLCRLRGSFFDPVDIQWRPDHPKKNHGLLLKTLLDAVKMCSPFFVCLLGETYGPYRDKISAPLVLSRFQQQQMEDFDWLDGNLLLAASGGHPWVLREGNQNKSITELEVLQGAFTEDNPYVTIYFRRSDHLDKKISGSENGKYTERDLSVYSSESQEARVQILDIRQRLVNKGVPVKYFSTLDELGRTVLDDWKVIIDLCLPPFLYDVKLLDSIEYREWIAQQSFVRSLSQGFLSTPDLENIIARLTEFALTCTQAKVKGEDQVIFDEVDLGFEDYTPWTATKLRKELALQNLSQSVLLLSGGRGVGKSSLVAHWLNAFKEDNPHICVISHFVSASSRSMDTVYFLQKTIKSLRQQFLVTDEYEANSLCSEVENECEDSYLSLCQAFSASLSLGHCVLLLDGVNEFQSKKSFDWLPEHFPKTCKLIITTTLSDMSHRCLSQRPDASVINFPSLMVDVNTMVAMISKHYPTLSQLIGGERTLQRLAQLKIMQTGLGLKVTGSELACHRVYSKLDIFLEQSAEVWSLRDFWTLCVQKWVTTHSWTATHSSELDFIDDGFDYSGWVTDCLSLIAASRNGLTAEQVISILKLIGYTGDLEVSNYDWLQFRQASGPTLRELGDGRLVFGHKYLQEIAEYLFFKSITSCPHDPKAIIRSSQLSRHKLYHKYLVQYFSQQKLDVQVMEELPWHLMFSGQTTNLVNYLTHYPVLSRMMFAERHLWQEDLVLYWSVCRRRGHHPGAVYLQVMHGLSVVDINDMQALEDTYIQSGMVSSAERHAASTPQLLESPIDDIEQKSFSDLRFKYESEEGTEKFHNAKVPENLIEKEDVLEGAFVTQTQPSSAGPTRSSSAKHFQSSFIEVVTLGWCLIRFLLHIQQRKASSVLLSSLVTYIKQKCLQTTDLYLLLCRCHHLDGKLHEVSGHFDEAEKSYRLALHAVVGAAYVDDDLTHQDDTQYLKGLLLSCHGYLHIHKKLFSEAEELLNEALDCVRDNTDAVVLKSTIYFYLGIIRSYQQDFEKAETCLKKSIKLRSMWFSHSHSQVADALISLAKLLAASKNNIKNNVMQAKSLYKQALAIQEKCFGPTHLFVAEILHDIGQLLSEVNTRQAKQEAQEYFRRCLDITTTTLGGDNPLTVAARQKLTKINVALQLKTYDTGSATDFRSLIKPFSGLLFHENDLSKLLKQDKQKLEISSEDRMSICFVSEDGSQSSSVRACSLMSTMASLTTACERLLSAPVSEMPCLLWRKRSTHSSPGERDKFCSARKVDGVNDVVDNSAGEDETNDRLQARKKYESDSVKGEATYAVQKMEAVNISTELSELKQGEWDQPIGVDLFQSGIQQPMDSNVSKKEPIVIKIQRNKTTNRNVQHRDGHETDLKEADNSGLDSYADVMQNSTYEKKPAIHRSAGLNQSVFPKFEKDGMIERPQSNFSGGMMERLHSSVSGGMLKRPQSGVTKSRNSQHNLWSGHTRSATLSSIGSRHSRCNVPDHCDIKLGNKQTVTGNCNSLTSLLDDPPCPRRTTNNLYHLSAWYHVPGRFPTPQEPLPKKRMQRTKTAKHLETLIAIKGLIPNQHEQYQLTDLEREQIVARFKNVQKQKTAFSFDSNRKPSIAFSKHFGYPKLDKLNSVKGLMVSGLEMPITRNIEKT